MVGGTATTNASVAISTFAGGITNTGTISVSGAGIFIGDNSTMALPRSPLFPAASITAARFRPEIPASGFFDVGLFADGIKNTGKVTAGSSGILGRRCRHLRRRRKQHRHDLGTNNGIDIRDGETFSGGITNSGKIAAGGLGIAVTGTTLFGSAGAGGITNSGAIAAARGGILVEAVPTFAGGIDNSGMISAGNQGG